jgi:hypothetical protein
VWARAHPTARKKLPNRFTRGSQFGYEDFANFCSVSSSLGRPVTHMVRGHDHVENRYFSYPAYKSYPILTTVGLSRRLSREFIGTYDRVPTVALYTTEYGVTAPSAATTNRRGTGTPQIHPEKTALPDSPKPTTRPARRMDGPWGSRPPRARDDVSEEAAARARAVDRLRRLLSATRHGRRAPDPSDFSYGRPRR